MTSEASRALWPMRQGIIRKGVSVTMGVSLLVLSVTLVMILADKGGACYNGFSRARRREAHMTTDSENGISLAHLRLPVSGVADSIGFFEALGAKPDIRQDNFAVVALRDGTRLQLVQAEGAPRTDQALQFDFVVADIDAAWADCQAKGLAPTEIARSRIHDSFVVVSPDGYRVKVNSRFNGG